MAKKKLPAYLKYSAKDQRKKEKKGNETFKKAWAKFSKN